MDISIHFLLFGIAVVANLLSAMAGGGAGLVQFPLLIFLGLPFGLALATHKIATVALGIGATMRHLREKTLKLGFTTFVLATGLPGVVLGASFILNVPPRMAEIALGVLTMGLGAYSFVKRDLGQTVEARNRDIRGMSIGGVVLFGLGVLNGSLTSGTGLFVTMWLVRWFGLDYKTAVAYTLVLVGLFWNGTGAFTLALMGDVCWSWLPALLLGSVIGGYVGAHLSIVKGNRLIKRMFEIITLLIGLKLIIGRLAVEQHLLGGFDAAKTCQSFGLGSF